LIGFFLAKIVSIFGVILVFLVPGLVLVEGLEGCLFLLIELSLCGKGLDTCPLMMAECKAFKSLASTGWAGNCAVEGCTCRIFLNLETGENGLKVKPAFEKGKALKIFDNGLTWVEAPALSLSSSSESTSIILLGRTGGLDPGGGTLGVEVSILPDWPALLPVREVLVALMPVAKDRMGPETLLEVAVAKLNVGVEVKAVA
jgi:hypothetical protein